MRYRLFILYITVSKLYYPAFLTLYLPLSLPPSISIPLEFFIIRIKKCYAVWNIYVFNTQKLLICIRNYDFMYIMMYEYFSMIDPKILHFLILFWVLMFSSSVCLTIINNITLHILKIFIFLAERSWYAKSHIFIIKLICVHTICVEICCL